MGSDLPPSPASGTRAFSRPGTVAAILVGCLGLAEFGVVAGGITGAQAVDDIAVEVAGTVSAIGALAVLLVVGWWHRVPRASAFQAVSGIVALVLLGGVVTWLTWLGQPAWDSPVGVNPDQSRLIAVVVADMCFGSWLMVARLVSPAPRPPAMGLAAVVLLAGAVAQVGSVIAWMNPALMAGPAGGASGPLLALDGLLVLGFLLLALWQVVLAVWLLMRSRPGSTRSSGQGGSHPGSASRRKLW